MTFKNLKAFEEWLHNHEEIDILEISPPEDENRYVTIHNLRDTDPIHLAEVFVSAYDTGLHFGAFFADRYNGSITFYE